MKKVKTIVLIITTVCFMMIGIVGTSPQISEVYAMNVNLAFGSCGGNLIWNLNPEGVLTISGTGAMKNYTCKSEMPWYQYISDIKEVVLQEGVTTISGYAFYGMTNLTSIKIPESVVSIGAYAFKGSTALENVVLPSKLTQLGESAFYGCTSLTKIDIPASLYTVRPYTFKNCTSLAKVTFHEGNLQKLSEASFYGTALKRVVIPNCTTIVDAYCFKNCNQLVSVTLSSNMTEIREASFYACTALRELVLPESVMEIKGYAFKKCTGLVDVKFPDSLEIIGESAFHSCTCLNQIMISANVEMIGEYAFSSCGLLKEIQFVGDAPVIGEGAFSKLTANAYYPADNVTWNSDVMQNYGGTLNWIGDSYTYQVVYESSNGVNLGNTVIAYRYGTENTISAPDIDGYVTPETQTILWDSKEPKTITFVYVPEKVFVSQEIASDEWYTWDDECGIVYTVYAEYRDRTAESVEVRLVWYNTLSARSDYTDCKYGYAQYFTPEIEGKVYEELKIADSDLWESAVEYPRSVMVETDWIKIPVSAPRTKIVVNASYRDSNGIYGSWENEMIIPTF